MIEKDTPGSQMMELSDIAFKIMKTSKFKKLKEKTENYNR